MHIAETNTVMDITWTYSLNPPSTQQNHVIKKQIFLGFLLKLYFFFAYKVMDKTYVQSIHGCR